VPMHLFFSRAVKRQLPSVPRLGGKRACKWTNLLASSGPFRLINLFGPPLNIQAD